MPSIVPEKPRQRVVSESINSKLNRFGRAVEKAGGVRGDHGGRPKKTDFQGSPDLLVEEATPEAGQP